MKTVVEFGSLLNKGYSLLAIGAYEGAKRLPRAAKPLDTALRGALQRVLVEGEFTGKVKVDNLKFEPETHLIHTLGRVKPQRLLLVGLGSKAEADLEAIRLFSAKAARVAHDLHMPDLAVLLPTDGFASDIALVAQSVVEGVGLALYDFAQFKTEKTKGSGVDRLTLFVDERRWLTPVRDGARAGETIVGNVAFARDLDNTPGSDCTPSRLAEIAKDIAKKAELRVTVLEQADMAKQGMGGLLGVARGSVEPPKLIVLRYQGASPKKQPIALVGKAITFDTGGISLKPWVGMSEMKYDKSGGVAVLAVLKAAAELRLPVNLVGIIPATENMPSGSALKPGDILKMYGGATAEILSTDAEGRLILADALTYALQFKPQAVIDIATLTLAVVIALGAFTTGLMGNDEALKRKIRWAGEITGERVWELPLRREYREMIKSDVADIKNSWGKTPAPAGPIIAAAFLNHFVQDVSWAHLDIAGTAWLQDGSLVKPYAHMGATGVPVRLLIHLLRNWNRL